MPAIARSAAQQRCRPATLTRRDGSRSPRYAVGASVVANRSGSVARVGSDPGLSRRSLLRGAALVAAAGLTACTGDDTPSPDTRTVTSGATPDPPDQNDVSLLVDAIADEERLLAYCVTVSRRHRSLRAASRPVQGRQRAHVAGLLAILTDVDPAPTSRPPRVPGDAQPALESLVEHIVQTRNARFDDCVAATSGLLAAKLASVSASHAASADLLAALRVAR